MGDLAGDVAAQRPFLTITDLNTVCVTRWQQASAAEISEALAAHPLIGDVKLLKSKFSATADAQVSTAFAEQGQVLKASDHTLNELARLNVEYKQRHGFIFIVFAKHLTADEMLEAIRARIGNITADEFAQAAAEQTKILQARIATTFGIEA